MFPCWMWGAWPACSEQQGLINNSGFIRVLPWLPQVSDGKLSGASDLGTGYSLGTRSQPCLARLPVPLPGQEQEGTQRDPAASLLCPVPAHVPLAALLGCWPWAGAVGATRALLGGLDAACWELGANTAVPHEVAAQRARHCPGEQSGPKMLGVA